MRKILNSQFSILNSERGQALLIVVLTMVIALTVGLSVLSRSVTFLRTTNEEQQSQKALSAAEAGVEQALKIDATGMVIGGSQPKNLGNGSQITSVNVTEVKTNQFLMYGGNVISKDDGADIWLSDYSSDSHKIYLNPKTMTINILWGESNTPCSNPAIEVILMQGTRYTPTTKHFTFEPCNSRQTVNHFTAVSQLSPQVTISNKTFYHQAVITASNGLIARVIPLYGNAVVGVRKDPTDAGLDNFPAQGRIIDSIGKSDTTVRKVTFFQGYLSLPSELFSHTLFCATGSGGGCNF